MYSLSVYGLGGHPFFPGGGSGSSPRCPSPVFPLGRKGRASRQKVYRGDSIPPPTMLARGDIQGHYQVGGLEYALLVDF